MKNKVKLSYEKRINILLITGMMLLTACGIGQKSPASKISLDKEGQITAYIAESFDQDHYDIDELQQMVLSEAASYNRTAGSSNISAEKIEVKDQMAVVELIYASWADYDAFNGVTFFVGSPVEAVKEGYDLNVVLSSVKDTNETIGEADILAMESEGMQLLITDVPEEVAFSGKALYADDHAILSENGKVLLSGEKTEPVYVLFRP